MVVVCKYGNCRERGTYNFKGLKPRFCKKHKEDGMVSNSSLYCEHDRRRSRCKPCGGSSFCEHGRRRSECKPCGGSAFCVHNLERPRCCLCSPESKHFCVRRHPDGTRCVQAKSRKYKNYCARCYVELFPEDELSKTAHLAVKELNCKKFLDDRFPGVFAHNRRLILSERDKSCTPTTGESTSRPKWEMSWSGSKWTRTSTRPMTPWTKKSA